jgi:hypothetical protein
MGEDRIDDLAVPLDDIEHAVRQAGFAQQFGQEQRCRRILLRGLQHERVAAGDGDREHPHRHHRREVERRDPGDDTERLAHGIAVHVRADVLRHVALQQVRNADAELDDLDTARHLPGRIRQHLAVFFGEDAADRVVVLFQQHAELQKDAGALRRKGIGPARQSPARGINGLLYVSGRAELDDARLFSGGRIEDRPVTRAR